MDVNGDIAAEGREKNRHATRAKNPKYTQLPSFDSCFIDLISHP